MRWLDYALQKWRSLVAEKYIRQGDILLDVGCYDGLFLARVRGKVSYAVGLEREIPPRLAVHERLILSDVADGLPFPDCSFDVVSLLAVFEHLQDNVPVVQEIRRVLRPGGRVVLTVPGRRVDRVLDVLIALGLADGMSLEEHHGYQAGETPALFEAQGFILRNWRRFQLGLNNLFVFEKL